MTTRKRIADYPAVFWAAVIATIVGGWMSVSAYNAMMHSDSGLYRAIGIFITLESVSIVAAATLNTRGNGLAVGFAAVLIAACASVEIFLGATELQRGIMQMTETAKASSAGTANATANAQALSDATKGLKSCQARYPRKQKDAAARAECGAPYEATIKSLSASTPAKSVEFNAEASGMLAVWEGITKAYNSMFGTDTTVEQIAFKAMLSIFAVFVFGKLFLWSRYAAWKTKHYGEHDQQHVTIDESKLGEPDAMPQPQASEVEPEPRKPFGFSPSNPAPSSAAINRALYSSMPVNTVTCNKQESVITGNCNKQVSVNTGNCNTGIQNSGYSTAYAQVQAAKVGHTVNCPNCGAAFVKANKWHTFCSNNRKPRTDGGNCSDDYHNAIDPERIAALKAIKRRNGKAA